MLPPWNRTQGLLGWHEVSHTEKYSGWVWLEQGVKTSRTSQDVIQHQDGVAGSRKSTE